MKSPTLKTLLPALLLAVVSGLPAVAQAKTAPDESIKTVEQAVESAKKDKKLIFIQMGREKCGNCQALKSAIASGKYNLPKKQFGWVELNCDDAEVNAGFKKHFKVDGKMLPFVAITNAKGEELASASGYITKQQFEALLSKAKSAAKKSGA